MSHYFRNKCSIFFYNEDSLDGLVTAYQIHKDNISPAAAMTKMCYKKKIYAHRNEKSHTKFGQYCMACLSLQSGTHNVHISMYMIMDFMCSAVWTQYAEKPRTQLNCAISIKHNLKMGVRPIFVTVVIVIHFSTVCCCCCCFFYSISLHKILYWSILSTLRDATLFNFFFVMAFSKLDSAHTVLFFIYVIIRTQCARSNTVSIVGLSGVFLPQIYLLYCWQRQHVTIKRNSNETAFFSLSLPISFSTESISYD